MPDGRGPDRFAPLLLASLLLHLVLMLAVICGTRGELPSPPQISLVMVDLDPGGRREPAPASAAVPPQGRGGAQTGEPAAPSRSMLAGAAAAVPALAAGAGSVLKKTEVPGGAPGASVSGRWSPESGASTAPRSEGVRGFVPAGVSAATGAGAAASAAASASASAGSAAKNTAGPAIKPTGGTSSKPAGGAGAGSVSSRAVGEGSTVVPSAAHSERFPGSAPAGDGAAARRSFYQARLKSLVEAHKEYPVAARKLGREGSCLRRFVLGRDGALQRVESLSSCGHPFLDGAATRAITAVGKFPPLPEEFGGAAESFTVTMTFTLAAK